LTGLALVALAIALALAADLPSARWVERLSNDGSPPPARDTKSPTGYVEGQRYFLGLHERGDTYRWIAATQRLLATGAFAPSHYDADTVPTGRHELLPRLYAGWVAAVAWIVHAFTGEALPLAVERTAIGEPIAGHMFVLLATAWVFGRRSGLMCAVMGVFVVAFFPLVSDQFLAGTLSPRPWALFLGAYAIVANLPAGRCSSGSTPRPTLSLGSAVTAAFALWLQPEIGFPSMLLCALSAAVGERAYERARAALRWSIVGTLVLLGAWFIDRAPLDVSAGELRYVHPYYALAWLGIGVALHVWLMRPIGPMKRTQKIVESGAALAFVAPLIFVQLTHGFRGWLFPSAAMDRLTSLDETLRYTSLPVWLGSVSPVESLLLVFPTLAGAIACGWSAMSPSRSGSKSESPPGTAGSTSRAVVYGGLLVLACLHVRWLVVTSLVALPLLWEFVAQRQRGARVASVAVAVGYFVALIAAQPGLSATLRKPTADSTATPADLEALVARHFSHWLASHNAGRPIAALAPPDLSDSLVFHGGGRVLMSTAWESYDGQVAASRVLSAPEGTEAEAMLQSREITHVILPSWDGVLPLLVREPKEADRTTLYARLQRWVLPPYLRPLAYRLPPIPSFEAQKLAVFQVTAPQDEALMLSRLAEYFVEVNRTEPAALVAKVLSQSFANDPNAIVARAIVAAATSRTTDFDAELQRLTVAPNAGEATLPWDRRVQRAVVFALGKRPDLARAAVERCAADATPEQIAELTPLAAHRLRTLMKAYELSFAQPEMSTAVAAMGAEYGAP